MWPLLLHSAACKVAVGVYADSSYAAVAATVLAVVAGMALAGGTSTNPLLHLNGIPASLYNLTQLEELQLFGVELRNGTLPADLGRLPFLQALHLQSGPGVTGTLPDWNGMTSLRELRVALGPNITGELCSCGRCTQIPACHTTSRPACPVRVAYVVTALFI